MSAIDSIADSPAEPQGRDRMARLVLLGLWAIAALWLASYHVPWRDEVRALTIALSGDTTFDMLRNLHGEGHPATWYLLLRWGHALVQSPLVLPILAFAIAAATMVVLALRSPLPLLTVALIMFGGLGLFEYTVSARNYGMSALVLFVFAALYPRWRDRGVTMGLVLFLLCNTNVPSNFLAAALLGFWLLEIVSEEGLRWHRKYGWWMANAAIAAAGALVCFLTVFPASQDAASISHPDGLGFGTLLGALTGWKAAFPDLAGPFELGWIGGVLASLALLGSLAGLLRSPGAFLAAAGVMLFFKLFFLLVYPGGYRHQGLLIMFLVTLYWLLAAGRGGHWPQSMRALRRIADRAARIGAIFFTLLLALQLTHSIRHIAAALQDRPYSRIHDLAELLEREGLTDAIVLGHPDVMVEALPYYADNPVYLLRNQRFGHVVHFTKNARLELSLSEILADAQRIARETGKPVVIALRYQPDPNGPERSVREGYLGTYYTDGEQDRRFLEATRLLARFGPAITDESYDVYLLTAS